jgi:hypothetical protein
MIDIELLPKNIEGFSIQCISREEAEKLGIDKHFSWFAWKYAKAVFSINNPELCANSGSWKILSENQAQEEAVKSINEAVVAIKKYQEYIQKRELVDNSRKATRYPSGSVGWAKDEDRWEW